MVLIASLNDDNNEQVAYDMVGALGGSKLFEHIKDEVKYSTIMEVFDSVADLELPNGVLIKNSQERHQRWKLVESMITDLSNKYL